MISRKKTFGSTLALAAAISVALAIPQSLPAAEPATVEDASKTIDFTKFPLFGANPEPDYRVVARQGYATEGTIVNVVSEIQRELTKRKWKEIEGTTLTPEYGTATYTMNGFAVTISAAPVGDGRIRIRVDNLGNVELKSLPLPRGVKEVYVSPLMAMYQSDEKVDDVATELRSSLTKQGWTPFGEVIGSFYVRKNAVKLLVRVDAAPGLEGKTVIQLSSEQLSCVIPLPDNHENTQYDDSHTTMHFDSSQSQSALIDFYKETLGKDGWKPTTENAVLIDFRHHLIFRNAKKELIEIEFQDVEGKTRTKIVFQTAEKVDELDRMAKIALEEAKKKREMAAKTPVPEARVKLAKGLKVVDKSDKSVETSVAAGQSRRIVKAWLKEWVKDGWKVETVVEEDALGEFHLRRDSLELHLDYVDPGVIPATVSLSVFGNGKLVISE